MAKEQVEPLKTENANAKAKIEQLEAKLAAISGGEDLKAQAESLTKENAALKHRIEELEEQQRSQLYLKEPIEEQWGGREFQREEE